MICKRTSTEPHFMLDEATKAKIESNWKRFTTWRPTNETATLCRLVRADEDTLHIATDVTYKDVVGLRFRQTLEETTIPFQVVTALAVVRTSDQHLVLIPRDSGDWEPSLECPGGFIRDTHLDNGRVSITDFITTRIMSDMALTHREIASVNYHTTFNAKKILEYMPLYNVTLTLSSTELAIHHPAYVIMPPHHTPATHHQFTNTSLHLPSRQVLNLLGF
jgi:hypothetical protein